MYYPVFFEGFDMKFTELKRHLKAGLFKPCYIIAGEDAGVRFFAHKLFVNTVTSFPELNINYFHEKADQTQIVDTCQGLPFMSDIRLVLVTDFVGDTSKFETYLQNPSPSTILVFENESIPNSFKKITQYCEIVDCGRQDEKFLSDYIARVAQNNGAQITLNATKTLIEYTNRYIFRINGEIQKLASEMQVIDEQAVREKVSPDLEVATFALTDALSERDKVKTMAVLDKMIADGHSSASAIGMMYTHYRKLFYGLINKDSDTLSTDLGVKEYALRHVFAQMKSYTVVQLKKICDFIAYADYGIKSGQIAEKNALYTCVLEILNVK